MKMGCKVSTERPKCIFSVLPGRLSICGPSPGLTQDSAVPVDLQESIWQTSRQGLLSGAKDKPKNPRAAPSGRPAQFAASECSGCKSELPGCCVGVRGCRCAEGLAPYQPSSIAAILLPSDLHLPTFSLYPSVQCKS